MYRELTVQAQIITIKWQLLKCACTTYLYWFPSQHCSITITKCKNNERKRHKIPAKFLKVDLDPDCTKIKIQLKQEKFLFWLMLESHSKINYFAICEIPDLLNHNINEGKK